MQFTLKQAMIGVAAIAVALGIGILNDNDRPCFGPFKSVERRIENFSRISLKVLAVEVSLFAVARLLRDANAIAHEHDNPPDDPEA